jgi:hypothetical protein
MAIFGNGFELKLTKFEEFKSSVNRFVDEVASNKKREMFRENIGMSSQSNISIDLYSRIYMNLTTGEKKRVLLYIDNQRLSDKYFSQDSIFPENLNRYHLYKCPTVDNVFSKKQKFNITVRQDGYFKYRFFNNFGDLLQEANDQKLLICKNCLTEFNIRNKTQYSNIDFYPEIYFSMERD